MGALVWDGCGRSHQLPPNRTVQGSGGCDQEWTEAVSDHDLQTARRLARYPPRWLGFEPSQTSAQSRNGGLLRKLPKENQALGFCRQEFIICWFLILWGITSAIISLLSAWPSFCVRSHWLSALYFQSGHHPVWDHLGCHLFTFSLAITLCEITSAVISLVSLRPSPCVRSHQLTSIYFQPGHHSVGAVVRPGRCRSHQLSSLRTSGGRGQEWTKAVGDHDLQTARRLARSPPERMGFEPS